MASSWRATGRPRLLPVNVTVSTNYRCNFKCATCNVYERPAQELELDEWVRVFDSLGKAPVWFTFSGGEPFLRKDLPAIVLAAIERCHPAVVNIPTNGWFTKRIVEGAARITEGSPDTQLVINLSVDHHVPERHDEIRGAPGSYERLLATRDGLRALNAPNLTVGCHSVVSRENDKEFEEITRGLRVLEADSYIAECAEERVELQTIGTGIGPDPERFARAAIAVLETDRAANGVVARLARSIRAEYYERAARYLAGDAGAMPVCHAGFLSCHIGADGDVWSCCTLARSLGNVREHDLDFRGVWYSEAAEEFRQWMRERRCACPLANAAYTNLMVEPGALARVAVGVNRNRVPAGLVNAASHE